MIQKLFTGLPIELNFRFPDIIFTSEGQRVELDIYLPTLALAFEYQGEPHYKTITVFGDHSRQRRVDERKKLKCKAQGISLIEIPYWWDGLAESLVATIQRYRPDIKLAQVPGKPISEQQPTSSNLST
jgi:hypothetical protein